MILINDIVCRIEQQQAVAIPEGDVEGEAWRQWVLSAGFFWAAFCRLDWVRPQHVMVKTY
jgi:hypothetical protein